MPVSKKTFFVHRMEFSNMLKAVKEIEAMNRADVCTVISVNDELLKKIKKDKSSTTIEDVMYK